MKTMAHARRCPCPVCQADRLFTLRGLFELAKCLFVLGLMIAAVMVFLALFASAPDMAR
jgi:type III secretory pathway component EscU